MQLIQAADAARLAGVSRHQLKEWCTRRRIVSPDVPGAGRGRHALFSWQTVLTVRVLSELHARFYIEIGAWQGGVNELRALLEGKFFPGLWDAWATFPDRERAFLLDEPVMGARALVALPLAPHLSAIAGGFSLPPARQLPLFPAVGLRR